MQFASEKGADKFFTFNESFSIAIEQKHIVDVAQIKSMLEFVLHKLVKSIQVHVSKELATVVAYR